MTPKRILIVDDNPEDLLAIRMYLEEVPEGGYVLHEAANGHAGIAAALAVRPDCILLDQHMPDIDGLEVLRRLRGPDGEATCAIVILTGAHDEAVITAALKGGAQDYMSKARLGPEALAQTVRGAIDRFGMLATQRKLEARYRAIVSHSEDAILSVTPDGTIETWNEGAATLFGWSAAEAVGRRVQHLIVPPDETLDLAEVVERLQRDGRRLDISSILTPLFEQGMLVAISVIVRDISERIRADQKIRFLMGEVAHRSKNMLSVIQAIAHQTGRRAGSMADFQERFGWRLQALAASIDLLVAEDWKGVDVAQLVRSQLASFGDVDGIRIRAEGPPRLLTPEAAQSLGLALHELATNAVKYGALSVASGIVDISWEGDPESRENPRFRMSWRERRGPLVSPPQSRGFGHVVTNKMVAETLRGVVEMSFPPEGISWHLDIPAEHTLAG